MDNEIIDLVLQCHSLDDILREHEVTEFETVRALIDQGLIPVDDFIHC